MKYTNYCSPCMNLLNVLGEKGEGCLNTKKKHDITFCGSSIGFDSSLYMLHHVEFNEPFTCLIDIIMSKPLLSLCVRHVQKASKGKVIIILGSPKSLMGEKSWYTYWSLPSTGSNITQVKCSYCRHKTSLILLWNMMK